MLFLQDNDFESSSSQPGVTSRKGGPGKKGEPGLPGERGDKGESGSNGAKGERVSLVVVLLVKLICPFYTSVWSNKLETHQPVCKRKRSEIPNIKVIISKVVLGAFCLKLATSFRLKKTKVDYKYYVSIQIS